MNALAITIISVIGTALFGMFYMQFKNLRDDMKTGFRAVHDRLNDPTTGLFALATGIKDLEIRLAHKFTIELKALDHKFTSELREHGERLARIETKLGTDPPAEAA